MTKEIWIVGSSKSKMYELTYNLDKNEQLLAKKNGLELIKKSKSIQNKELKYIYCSPTEQSIESAIEIINIIKEKLNYEIKKIIVYELSYNYDMWPHYYEDDNLIITKPTEKYINDIEKRHIKNGRTNYLTLPKINNKLKKLHDNKYKKYISKKIGTKIKSYNDFPEIITNLAKSIINIDDKATESYIILGDSQQMFNILNIAYKYFNQYDKDIPNIKNDSYNFDTEFFSKKTVRLN